MSELLDWTPGIAPSYPKIYSPFKRSTLGPDKNRLLEGVWSDSAFATLQNATWRWTEKLDGTSVRIHWDGVRRYFGGRTDRAAMPQDLKAWVDENMPEELFEQMFQDKAVTLYGEGIGAGTQKGGGNYSSTKKFVLFDVLIDGVWRTGDTITEVAEAFGIEQAKEISRGPVQNAIDTVSLGLHSAYGSFLSEGLVGVPVDGFLNYRGGRIMMKVKTEDFYSRKMVLANEQ